MKIAGLDIGTTGCKCTVFDERGKYLDHAYQDYPVKRSMSGHEIDMWVLRDAVLHVVSEMAFRYPDIMGLGVTSFGETFVLTDEKGNPLDVAMLYTDPRGKEECQELIEKLGDMHIAEITGLRPHEMYGICKLMWMKKHKPEIYHAAKHMFQVEDFIVFVLSGVAQIDYSLATRSMVLDVTLLSWSDEIIRAADVDKKLFSKVVPTGTPAGKIKKQMAERTGLCENTIIVSVSQDQVAAAIGAGAFTSDVAVDGAGTVECMTPIFDTRPDIKELYKGYFATVPYVVPGKYVTYAFSYTGGALTQWCTKTLAKQEIIEAKEQNKTVNLLLEEKYAAKMKKMGFAEDEPSGLLVLPHFAGAATPYMDTGSKGAVIGLTTDTTVEEIYMGCLEGVCYEMFQTYQYLKTTGICYKRFHATGGGAHSAVWMQMKADVLNVPFVALNTVDAGTVGCAMMTGIAIGIFRDLEDAAQHMVEKTKTYEPRKEQHEKYMAHFARYEKLYDAIRPLV